MNSGRSPFEMYYLSKLEQKLPSKAPGGPLFITQPRKKWWCASVPGPGTLDKTATGMKPPLRDTSPKRASQPTTTPHLVAAALPKTIKAPGILEPLVEKNPPKPAQTQSKPNPPKQPSEPEAQPAPSKAQVPTKAKRPRQPKPKTDKPPTKTRKAKAQEPKS